MGEGERFRVKYPSAGLSSGEKLGTEIILSLKS